jgi:hypothetical protein
MFVFSFRHAQVISKTLKSLAWVVVFVLNAFFVYFSLLRGLQRGRSWQVGYALACVLQFAVEVQ